MDSIYTINLKRFRHIILISFYALSIPIPVYAETVPLKVIMNTVDKGEHIVVLTPENDILLSTEQLKALGFVRTPEKTNLINGLVSLKSLAPKVQLALNVQESSLFLTVSPDLLGRHSIDLKPSRPEDVIFPTDNSAFINYSINYNTDGRFDIYSINVPAEIGVQLGDYLVESNGYYAGTDAENKFVRLMTNIIKDDPENIIRYTAGDFFASSGVLGGSAMLGGVSITKNFSMDPYFVRYPGLQLSGLLRTPSQMDLYINDMLVKQAYLGPGEFDYSDLYSQTGAGNTVIVIKDAFGREETITTPFYLSTSLLKSGLHDYSYSLGLKRQGFGERSNSYGGVTLLSLHRYGFTDFFTGGIRAEADKDVINLGTMATFLVARAGVIDSSLAFSNSHGKRGYAAFINYTYNNNFFNGNASFTRYSKDYTNLSLQGGIIKPRLQVQAGVGFNANQLGSISFSFQFISKYHEPGLKRENAFYSRSIGHNVSLSVRAARLENSDITYEFFAGLVFTLGKDRFGTMSSQSQHSHKAFSAGIEKNPPIGPGFGYRIQANIHDNEKETFGGNSYLQYNGSYGIYSATVRRVSGENNYNLGISGGIELIDRSVYLSRPVNDSFALVKIGGIEGAKIYYSNNKVAVTNSKGEAIVPSLISYIDNKLTFDTTDVPINYELEEIEKYIAPPYRSGSVVLFGMTKIQAFEGRVFLVADRERVPAESAVLEVNEDGEAKEAVVGKRGEFYLQNLKPGRFPARITLGDKECTFEISVPESGEMNVNLGDLSCEME